MKRRHFLQATGATVTTIALHSFFAQLDRYTQVLAQDAPRKFALLVGINEYEDSDRGFLQLNGCTTDVELQRQLLIHRFGFESDTIKTLKDAEATREGILQAFDTHLIKQAKPGDLVVFHYSGHGSQVIDPTPINGNRFNSTIVPYGAEQPNPDGTINDIMGRTLFLLMRALQTQTVTIVLDCCHSGGATRGAGRVRSGNSTGDYYPSRAELGYQENWRKRLNLAPAQLRALRAESVAKGAVLASADRTQEAVDFDFPGFSAGAFTYLLTQYLWEQSGSFSDLETVLPRSLYSLVKYRQQPVFELEQATLKTRPLYFLSPQRQSAQAVIKTIRNGQATIWLGGLDPISLNAFAIGSTFAILDQTGQKTGTAILNTREGLQATATLQGKAQPGAFLQEIERVIPNDLRLKIGIDPSIAQQTTEVQTILNQLNRVEAIPAQTGNIPYPNSVDYIISRITPTHLARIQTQPKPPLNAIALFTASLEFLPNTGTVVDQKPLSTVIQEKLAARIQSLVAAHIIRQTLNPRTSNLKLEVQLQHQDQPNAVIASAATQRQKSALTNNPIQLKTAFQFKVLNREATPLYLLIALVSPSGRLSILFPNRFTEGTLNEVSQITPDVSRLVPDRDGGDSFKFVSQLTGRGEALILASRTPLDRVYKRLQSLAAEQSNQNAPLQGERGGDAISELLSDLSRSENSAYTINTNDVATLAIPFEII